MPPYGRTDIAVGTLIEGRYEILAKIGEGAQGTVYRARDRRLGIDVALKALAADPDDDTLVSRFQREVEMLTRLRHPNIVTVSDCHDWHGRPYYVMELCGDGDVMRLINSRVPLTLARIAEIGRSDAFGLQAAHALGVRDAQAA